MVMWHARPSYRRRYRRVPPTPDEEHHHDHDGRNHGAPVQSELSLYRLHLMRGGYLLVGVGLAVVKWPLLPGASDLPLFEGVTLCLLTAMSLLAFLGLRYPVKLLPLLLFESAWKLLWLGLVALPRATSSDSTPPRVTSSSAARWSS